MILAIETSTRAFSLALMDNMKLKGEIFLDSGMRHSDLIIRNIETILRKKKTDISDITKIACATGPGSFTGIRMGLCAARTLSQFLCVPSVGVSTLDVIAGGYFEKRKDEAAVVFPVIRSTYDEAFISAFIHEKGNLKRVSPYSAVKTDDIVNTANAFLGKLEAGKANYITRMIFVCENDGLFLTLRNVMKKNKMEAVLMPPRAAVLARLSGSIKGGSYLNLKPFYLIPPRIRPVKSGI